METASSQTTPHCTTTTTTTLEGHHHLDDHIRGSGGRAFLKSTTTVGVSSSPSSSSSQLTTPSSRRTRHRVDAGEPRGCFNNYYSPRNIFQSSTTTPSSQHHHNSDFYFQPMKMLSDFIGNSHHHINNSSASQLLLREMLQKKKVGYEDDVVNNEIQPPTQQSSEESSFGHASSSAHEEIKINGCKKRKLYQPQRSEFDDEDRFKDLDDEVDMDYKNNSGDEDDEVMLKSPMAPLTRQLLTCERKQIPRSILQNWKDNFKSTLMSHINELVDSQFAVLFGSIGSLQSNNNNIQSSPTTPPPSQTQGLHNLHHHNNNNNNNTTNNNNTHNNNNNSTSVSAHQQSSQDIVHKNHFNGGGGILLDNEKLRMRFYRPPYSSALAGLAANNNNNNNSRDFEDDGPLSLVVTPKKKRHKVTDTRLTPRAVSRLLGAGSVQSNDHYLTESSPSPRTIPTPPSSVPISLPTSVAIPNPSLTDSRHLFAPYAPLFNSVRSLESPPTLVPHPMINPVEYVQQLREISAHQQAQREQREAREHQAALLQQERGGSAGSADSGDTTGGSFEITGGSGVVYGPGHSSSTLTPMHLRKAKLMFFWVRYPSSAVLKMYFPDIKFNKNNTAQLVKWFSNFREFYYIQMEKYARQALSEGIKISEDIHVSTENELYRVLNLHYNRNNHIEVPSNFRYVVEQTLREFFKAIQTGKDSEQSWKKAIYKIIARLDDPVPEYFKSPNFLEQLE